MSWLVIRVRVRAGARVRVRVRVRAGARARVRVRVRASAGLGFWYLVLRPPPLDRTCLARDDDELARGLLDQAVLEQCRGDAQRANSTHVELLELLGRRQVGQALLLLPIGKQMKQPRSKQAASSPTCQFSPTEVAYSILPTYFACSQK